MHWFKHDTGANMDAKLQEVLLDYGLEGYGLYWYCIELIAGKISKENITFALEHDARIIARNTGSTVVKVEEMMRRFVALGLFENSGEKITCMKLARRLDQSMTSNPSMRALIASIKNHDDIQNNHDAIMTESSERLTESCKNRTEQKRTDKNKIKEKSPRAQKLKFNPATAATEKTNITAWTEWIDYRESKGKKISEAAAKKQVKFLANYPANVQQQIVDKSITNDYQGLFEPQVQQQFGQQQQQAPQPRRALTHD